MTTRSNIAPSLIRCGASGKQIFLAVGEGHRVAPVAPDVDQPGFNDRAGVNDALNRNPRLNDLVRFDEGSAHLADPHLDQPVRQAGIRTL